MTNHQPNSSAGAFLTTRWTMVMQARGNDPKAKAALSELCESYWSAVFRFLLRESRSEDESRELTQEFFARILAGGIGGVDPSKGRFRSYLLGALKHFLAERKRNESRLKRGGGSNLESIDGDTSELQIADPNSTIPDAHFDREWALAVMDRGLDAVKADFEKGSKAKQFTILKPWLMGDSERLSQAEAARELGITTGAIKVAIHRMRKSFRDAIQEEIAQTVEDPEEVADELRYLIEVLS